MMDGTEKTVAGGRWPVAGGERGDADEHGRARTGTDGENGTDRTDRTDRTDTDGHGRARTGTDGGEGRRPVLYLCGPMTGYQNANREAFADARMVLEAAGYAVLSPAVWPDGLSGREYMRLDLPMLLAADGVAVLPGWEHAAGCRAELEVALYCGMRAARVETWPDAEWAVEFLSMDLPGREGTGTDGGGRGKTVAGGRWTVAGGERGDTDEHGRARTGTDGGTGADGGGCGRKDGEKGCVCGTCGGTGHASRMGNGVGAGCVDCHSTGRRMKGGA